MDGVDIMARSFKECIVDGYNLLHKLFPDKTQHSLQEKRELAEQRLLQFQRSTGTRVTIVYDGRQSGGPFRETGALNRVFTSHGHSADAWIVDYLKSLGRKAQMFTIISSDRFICRHATASGASYMLSEEFIERYLSGAKGPQGKGEGGANRKKFSKERLSQKEVDHWLALFGETKE